MASDARDGELCSFLPSTPSSSPDEHEKIISSIWLQCKRREWSVKMKHKLCARWCRDSRRALLLNGNKNHRNFAPARNGKCVCLENFISLITCALSKFYLSSSRYDINSSQALRRYQDALLLLWMNLSEDSSEILATRITKQKPILNDSTALSARWALNIISIQ